MVILIIAIIAVIGIVIFQWTSFSKTRYDIEEMEKFFPNINSVSLHESTISKSDLSNRDRLKSIAENPLHAENPRFSYQLVIEGTAAIKWEQKANGTYNADNQEMYWLSYRRALALYNRWKAQGLDLRKYNTEIIIAGSGFNGINRDNRVEDNNKRFIIQIIPKVSRPMPTQ